MAIAQISPTSLELTEQEVLYIEQNPLIKVHVQQAWAPYNFIDNGKASGYSNDLISLVANKVGLDIEFIIGYQWVDYLGKLKNKDIDVISNMKITPTREQYAIFTQYYALTPLNGLLTLDNAEDSTDFNKLKSISVVEGTMYQERLESQYPSLNLVLTTDIETAIEQLKLGNVDAVLDAYEVINYYLQSSSIQGVRNTALNDDKAIINSPYFMAVHKDNIVLRNILNKGLLALNKSERNELSRKWSLLGSSKALKHEDIELVKRPFLSERQREYLNLHGPMKMCVDPDWLPIEAIENGEYIGIGAEFLALFAKRIDKPVMLVETHTWVETLNAFRAGKCDFIPVISSTNKRLTYMAFSSPYLHFPLVLATHQDNKTYTLQQALHRPLGIVEGYGYKDRFDELYPDGNLIEYKSIEAGLKAVNSGEIYGFIESLPVMTKSIQEQYPEMKIVDKFEEQNAFSVAVAIDDPVLLDIFNRVIASITLQEQQYILNRWLPVIYEKNRDVSAYWMAIAVLAFLLVLLMLRLSNVKKLNIELEKIKSKYETIGMRDYLTGLPNQYYFQEQLSKEWIRGRRSGEQISLLIIDVDNFKLFNGVYGRAAGDECLIELAGRLQSIIKRPADSLSRFHGEEFMVILPNTDEDGLKAIAADIFYMMNSWGVEFKGAPVGEILSVSIGAVCMLPNGKYPETELSRRAEQALYQAQDKGFNQMVIYQSGY
ncbi:transporter substrate-binding domain-containing protein [Psychromonas sp.]|nr:transporter substrate-binding domain-containing protein [Psychromonas sp.]